MSTSTFDKSDGTRLPPRSALRDRASYMAAAAAHAEATGYPAVALRFRELEINAHADIERCPEEAA